MISVASSKFSPNSLSPNQPSLPSLTTVLSLTRRHGVSSAAGPTGATMVLCPPKNRRRSRGDVVTIDRPKLRRSPNINRVRKTVGRPLLDDGDNLGDWFLGRGDKGFAEEEREDIGAVLSEWMKNISELPRDLSLGLELGLVSSEELTRFLENESMSQ